MLVGIKYTCYKVFTLYCWYPGLQCTAGQKIIIKTDIEDFRRKVASANISNIR